MFGIRDHHWACEHAVAGCPHRGLLQQRLFAEE
jgi:hypothetical protein